MRSLSGGAGKADGAGSFGCRVFAGRQHLSPGALQFASRPITQGARQRDWARMRGIVRSSFEGSLRIRDMPDNQPNDFRPPHSLRVVVRNPRTPKASRGLSATIRMLFHTEPACRPESLSRRTPQRVCSPRFRSRARGSRCCGSGTPLPPAGRLPDVADPARER